MTSRPFDRGERKGGMRADHCASLRRAAGEALLPPGPEVMRAANQRKLRHPRSIYQCRRCRLKWWSGARFLRSETAQFCGSEARSSGLTRTKPCSAN